MTTARQWRAVTPSDGDDAMLLKPRAVGLLVLTSLFTGCAQLARQTPQAAAVDDETYCSNLGSPGTDAFAKCLKDRDVARERSEGRMEAAHRGLSDRMLNGR